MKLLVLENIGFGSIKMERKSRLLTNMVLILIPIQIMIAPEIQGQRSGFSRLVHNAMNTAWNNTEPYLNKLIPPTVDYSKDEVTNSEEHDQSTTDSGSDKDNGSGGVFSNIMEKLKTVKMPEMPKSSPGSIITESSHNFVTDLLKPVQDTGAIIVEGAVRTGVDQAVTSIVDSFKIDMVLVIAVLVIQIVLFVCGAHLCFYVYKRESEMRSYVKQQVNLMKRIP